MTMQTEDALTLPTETDVQRVLARSEVETQIEAAHRFPRSIKKFLSEALSLATLSQEIAESCIYTLPRSGKTITGPSVRMAEIVVSAYGNMHAGARIIGAEYREVISQGVAWDLEKNVRVTVETRRKILDKKGHRYNDDMITVTGNAAASISLRNAIFLVVTRAYVDHLYSRIREVAVGNAQTLAARRDTVIARLGKMGVTPDRVLARVGKLAVEDVGIAELEILIGLGTAIKNGDATPDDAFPAPSKPSSDVGALEHALRAQPATAAHDAPPPEPRAQRAAAPTEPAPPPSSVTEMPRGRDTAPAAHAGTTPAPEPHSEASQALVTSTLDAIRLARTGAELARIVRAIGEQAKARRLTARQAEQLRARVGEREEEIRHEADAEPPPGALDGEREPGVD